MIAGEDFYVTIFVTSLLQISGHWLQMSSGNCSRVMPLNTPGGITCMERNGDGVARFLWLSIRLFSLLDHLAVLWSGDRCPQKPRMWIHPVNAAVLGWWSGPMDSLPGDVPSSARCAVRCTTVE